MARKKQILFPVLFMLILTIVYTFVLAYINESSLGIIKEQEALRVKRSVLYVFNQPSQGITSEVTKLFDEKIEIKTIDERTTYVLNDNGTLNGYAFSFSGTGLWGSIYGYIAISPDFTKVLGIDFVAHSETPGLGGRIDESWYKEQFRGLAVSDQATVIYKPNDGGTLDAITGATLTSDAVRKMVNAFIIDTIRFAKEASL